MQPRLGERSTPNSLVLTVRTSHDKSLSFKGPQHAAEITGVNSQAATKLPNFGTVVSNLPKQSSLAHWPTSLEKPVAEGTDALRDCSVETADFLNRGYLYFSDHSQRLCRETIPSRQQVFMMGISGIRSLLVESTMLPSTCCTTLASYQTMQFGEGMSLKLRFSGDNRPVSTIQSCIPRQIANTSRETGQDSYKSHSGLLPEDWRNADLSGARRTLTVDQWRNKRRATATVTKIRAPGFPR